MSTNSEKNSLLLVIGVVLVVAGGWALLGTASFIPGLIPLREMVYAVQRIAWPLVLIGGGVLLILAARQSGGIAQRFAGKTWTRSKSSRMVAGVLGGFAEYGGFDPTLVRIAFVAAALLLGLEGPALIAYILGAVLIPDTPATGTPMPAPPIPTSPTPAPPAPPVPPVP